MKCTKVIKISPYAIGWHEGKPLYKDEVECGGDLEKVGQWYDLTYDNTKTLYQCASCRKILLQ